MVETMQFRDYLFQTNPAEITVREPQGLARHFCPGRGEIVQNIGAHARTVECRGTFWGNSFAQAMEDLLAFRRVAGQGERGMLLVPGLEPFWACLREFAFDATGDGKIIPYTMVFVEAREMVQ